MQSKFSMSGLGLEIEPGVRTLRCGSWCAVSSEEQAKEGKSSMGLQAAGNRAFIEDAIADRYAGYAGAVVREYTVEGTRDISQLSDAVRMYPDGYGALVNDILARKIDAVVCKEMSRLGRSAALLTTVQEIARLNGVLVITMDAPPATLARTGDTADILLPLLQNGMAAVERANLLKRTIGGRESRVSQKRLFGAKPPYGYRYEWQDGKAVGVVIEPREAQAVRHALVDCYVGEGLSTPEVAQRLNDMGAPTPSSGDKWDVFDEEGKRCRPASGKWSFISVVALVRRAHVYAGTVEYNRHSGNAYRVLGQNGEVVIKRPERRAYIRAEGVHPHILTPEEAALVEAEAQSRTYNKRTRLYSGCVYCEQCGSTMSGTTVMSGGKRVSVMGCYGGRGQKGACNQRIQDAVLTDAILRALDVLEATPDAALAALPAQSADHLRAAAALEQARNVLAALDAERTRVQGMEIRGRLTEKEADAHYRRIERDLTKSAKVLSSAQQKAESFVDAGQRMERVAEVRRSARTLMAHAESDPDLVRPWLRRHVRLTVSRRDAGKGIGVKRVKVEFI